MTIHEKSTEGIVLKMDRTFINVALHVPCYDFIAYDSQLQRSRGKPQHQCFKLRVRLTRPDGSQIEPIASINLGCGHNPPADSLPVGLEPEEAPVGTEVELLRPRWTCPQKCLDQTQPESSLPQDSLLHRNQISLFHGALAKSFG